MEWKAAVEKTIAELLADRDMRRFENTRYPATIARPQSVVLDLRVEPVPGGNGQRQLRVSDIEYADDFDVFVMPADPCAADVLRNRVERGWWPSRGLPRPLVARFIDRLLANYQGDEWEVPNATDR